MKSYGMTALGIGAAAAALVALKVVHNWWSRRRARQQFIINSFREQIYISNQLDVQDTPLYDPIAYTGALDRGDGSPE
jgi:hypothetical protein